MFEVESWTALAIAILASIVGGVVNAYLSELLKWSQVMKATLSVGIILGTCILFVLLFFQPAGEPIEYEQELSGNFASIGDAETMSRRRTFELGRTNDHCSGPANVTWKVKASDGWSIDIQSIKIIDRHVSQKSSGGTVSERDEDEFVITGRVVNNGECIRAFGKTIAKDGRGTIQVKGNYLEVQKQAG